MGSFNSDWGRVTFWISTSWTTHDLDNYRMLIRHIIQYTDGLQRLESFLRPHVRKRVRCDQDDVVIECEWLCIGPCRPPTTTRGQGKVDIRVDGSFNCWRSIWRIPEGSSWFAQCGQSPSKCLVSVIQVTHHGNITRHCRTHEDRRVVIVVVLHE